MMSRGECQWVHWVRGVRERPWTVGVDMVWWSGGGWEGRGSDLGRVLEWVSGKAEICD